VAIVEQLASVNLDQRMAEEAIKKVQAKLKADDKVKTLQESVDKLQQENQALQSRLAKLETLVNRQEPSPDSPIPAPQGDK
jgi:aminopeptidase N